MKQKTIFWNVDTQYDFMRNDETFKGKLAIPDARDIEGNLEILTQLAKTKNLQVINTADWHNKDTKEIAEKPDYVNTFPAHCIECTEGARFIPATKPDFAYVLDWKDQDFNENNLKTRNIVLYKDKFDIFAGNKYANNVLKAINPDRVVVYGVATNVCVDYAVKGLLDGKNEVYAVTDAMKELPGCNLEKIFGEWKAKGAILVKTTDIEKILGE